MKTSDRGLAEIASHEGIVNAPYRDSVGVWTVGIGHTAAAGLPNPKLKRGEYSMAEIMDIFRRDIEKFEARVRRAFMRDLTQEQFDAAVSFDFNTGGILKASWVKKFNAGDTRGARKSFMDWRKPPEILPRRRAECALFFDGTYSSNGRANVYPATPGGKVLWGRGKAVDVLALMIPSSPAIAREQLPGTTTPQKPKPAPAKPAGPAMGIAALVLAGLAAAGAWLASLPCEWLGILCGG